MRFWHVLSTWLLAFLLGLSLWTQGAGAQDGAWFTRDTLNAGLGPPPETLDRSTPQASMEALLRLSEAGDPAAAHLLDLSEMDPATQRARGPLLARQVRDIIQRKVVLDWDRLLDRPDALDAEAPDRMAVAGQARRSILLENLDLGHRTVELRLNRIKTPGADPVWVIASQSVENIPALHRLYGPSRLERSLPDWARQGAFWTLMWWEVVALPLVLLAALAAAWLARRAMKAATARIGNSMVQAVLEAVRGPVLLVTLTGVIAVLTRAFFVFSGEISSILDPGIVLGFTVAALLLVVNGIDAVLDRLVAPDSFDELREADRDHRRDVATKVAAGRRALVVLIVVVGGGIVLSESHLFSTLGFSLLTSAGALTLVLGFAARKVLGNIMSSMQIALNRSAKIGDKVVFKGYMCNVERIHFTYVQLRVWTGIRLIVPVEEFVGEAFENWTAVEPAMSRLIVLRLHHEAEVEPLRQAFFDLIDTLEAGKTGNPEDHFVAVTDQDVFGKEVTFSLACADANTAWMLSCEMREKLLERARRMEAEGHRVFPDANPAESV